MIVVANVAWVYYCQCAGDVNLVAPALLPETLRICCYPCADVVALVVFPMLHVCLHQHHTGIVTVVVLTSLHCQEPDV